MKSRRQFLLACGLGSASWRSSAQPRRATIGVLVPRPIEESIYASHVVRSADLGYRQGAGMHLEYRSADGFAERYTRLARELIDARCDVIFAIGDQHAARALRDARTAVPTVFLAVDYDPVEKGIIAGLSRPEGNITGVYMPQNALVAKRVEIMREVVPGARRFLVFADVFSQDQISAARTAAEAAAIEISLFRFAKRPYDYAGAFEAARNAKAAAYVALASPVFTGDRQALSALWSSHRFPSIGTSLQDTRAGYLLSLSTEVNKVAGRVAEMAVRILGGAKPAGIPVEQADEFELVINAKTAAALGVKIPESVLARAIRIVQ